MMQDSEALCKKLNKKRESLIRFIITGKELTIKEAAK